VALIVAASKFISGAWMVIILIPALMALLLAIRRHYERVEAALEPTQSSGAAGTARGPIVIVPIARLDRAAAQAIAFARSVSPDAIAVHVTNDTEAVESMRRAWADWGADTKLVIVESPYRALIGPLLAYMDALQRQDPSRPVLVVLSELVPRHWWEMLLHNQTALRLKLRLFVRRNTIVADVPYHLA
jgi:hypothetical protein